MAKNKELQDFKKQILECVKCGACQAHCPAYRESRKEGSVARGKIALACALLDGAASLDDGVEQDISMCLMCGSCVHTCPNKVPTHEIVGAIRREVTDNKGLSLIGRGVASVTGSRALMKTLTKSGALLSPLVLKKVPESSGLRLRFPSSQMKDRTVPQLPIRNLFDRLPVFIKGKPDKPVVGFFSGCSITYVYPEVGVAMVDLLKKMGCSVHIPRSQGCCGIPALSSGAGKAVEKLSETNVGAFGQYEEEYIITACASCNGGLGEYYSTMKGDYDDFTKKVMDFSVFLGKMGVVDELIAMKPWEKRTKVTYHDPCHLKTQGITKEPRALLKSLPNVDFVEMENGSLCCGLGGTFSVYHYESSKAIGLQKIPGLVECGAEKIATACPGCIMQLQDVINHAGLHVKAVHILDLMSEAYSDEGSN